MGSTSSFSILPTGPQRGGTQRRAPDLSEPACPRSRPGSRAVRVPLGAAVLLGSVLLCVAMPAGAADEPATKTSATERAARRAYDGAPPVIPHRPVGVDCTSCHSREGTPVPDLGFAPPSPHLQTSGLSAISRCEQCHVFRATTEVWRESDFQPLRQDLRRGRRFHAMAPPVIPHKVFMRESCQACHTGPAAREEIRTSHPERARCRQCHLEQKTTSEFVRGQ